MKCPYCGKELPEGSQQCDGCGVKFTVANQINQKPYNNSSPTQDNYQQQNDFVPQKSGNDKSGILILILFLAAIVVASYFLFFAGGNDKNDANSEKEKSNVENNNNSGNSENTASKLRYQKFFETGAAFVSAVKTDVNMGNKLKLYDTNAIYFLPVGNNKDCGVLESGGSSPLGGEWNYAFVAVTYDGNGYGYYFIAEDSNIIGTTLIPSKNLLSDNYSRIYNNHIGVITNDISNELKELYNITENKTYTSDLPKELDVVLTPENQQKSKYVFISGNSCKSS